MGLEERVEQLERRLAVAHRKQRRDRRILALIGCGVMLVAAGEPLKTLRAHRVEIGPRDVPRIVLGEGKDGPIVELRDKEGFVATLTARGLSLAAPEPIDPPTLAEPGLATVDEVEAATMARISVEDYASSVEVACPGLQYRERTQIVGGGALVHVPDDPKCTAHVKGGPIIGRFPIRPGASYRCAANLEPKCQREYRGSLQEP
jgi:hypothetical protein